jgi:hypothetical protein
MSEDTGQIFDLMSKVMGDIKAISKDRTNEFDHYQFRGIDDIYNAVQPALVKHGVIVVPKVVSFETGETKSSQDKNMRYVVGEFSFTFHAPDGSSVTVSALGEAFDRGDKSANKAMSAAMKYAFLQTFCIPTGEKIDTENESPQPSAPTQRRPSASTGGKKSDGTGLISEKQGKRLFAIWKSAGISEDRLREIVKDKAGVESTKEIGWKVYDDVCTAVEAAGKEREPGGEEPPTAADDENLPW